MDALLGILSLFLTVMYWLIIARAIISWIDPRGSNPVSQFLFQVTEPIIAPIRSVMPRTGMIDLSPFIAIMVIFILQRMIASAASG